MKKILALLMAVALLATLTACGGNTEPNTDTSTTTTTNVDTTTTTEAEESTTTTEATDEGTTTATEGTSSTAKPTESTKTDAPHTHKYTSKVTKAATCAVEGVKTFTCSCGDTYTEKVAATAHKWGEWKQTTAPSYTAKGKETRTCSGCSKKETRDVAQLSLDKLFEEYTNGILGLPAFDSVNELTATDVFKWVIFYQQTYTVKPIEQSYDEIWEIVRKVYSISDIDAYTTELLNCTRDYSVLDGDIIGGMYKCAYDATNKTITIESAGGFGSWGPIYKGYKQIDSTHYVVAYDTEGGPNGNTFEVELIDGKYVIVANNYN